MTTSETSRATILWSDHVVLGGGPEPLRIGPARIRIEAALVTELVELAPGSPADLPSEVGVELVDLRGRLVSPAFVNGHAHLAMCAFRGLGSGAAFEHNVVERLFYALEAGLTAEDVRAFTRLGAYESLLAGVGTVWDHYYGGTAVAEALLETGLGGVVAPTLQDLGGPGSSCWQAQLEATARIDEDARYARAGVYAAAGPHATDTVSDELLNRTLELATSRDLPLHLHLAQSLEEYVRSHERHGCSPTERLARHGLLDSGSSALLVHALFLTTADHALLDPQRHVLGYCPLSQARFAFPADPTSLERAGLRWVVGTDCAASNDSMNVQKELRAAAAAAMHAVTYGGEHERFSATGTLDDARAVGAYHAQWFARAASTQDPTRLLATVWHTPGTLHPRFHCGVIRSGALANLVVWNLQHPAFWPATDPLRALAYGDTTGAIEWLMIAGRFVGERGRFAASICDSAAYAEARREADARLSLHLERLGMRLTSRSGTAGA